MAGQLWQQVARPEWPMEGPGGVGPQLNSGGEGEGVDGGDGGDVCIWWCDGVDNDGVVVGGEKRR